MKGAGVLFGIDSRPVYRPIARQENVAFSARMDSVIMGSTFSTIAPYRLTDSQYHEIGGLILIPSRILIVDAPGPTRNEQEITTPEGAQKHFLKERNPGGIPRYPATFSSTILGFSERRERCVFP